MTESERLRLQASRLLALALAARDDGNHGHANWLSEQAAIYLSKADDMDGGPLLASPVVNNQPPSVQQPQQQQQAQPEDDQDVKEQGRSE